MAKNQVFSRMLWRWHFYAGLFIAPLIITLSLSGIAYLFKGPIEDRLYKDVYFGQSAQSRHLTLTEAIPQAESQFSGYTTTKVTVFSGSERNTRLSMYNADIDNEKYVYLDDNNQVVGTQNADSHYSNITRNFHSSLLVGGTLVNYLVELAACWAVFLMVSGIVMSWKKIRKAETLRQKFKNRHTFTGLIFAVPMVILIATGLPWSAFMGNQLYTLATSNQSLGYPPIYSTAPQSERESSDLPWATQHENPPQSAEGSVQLTVDEMEKTVREQGITTPYVLRLPNDETGVYTVSKSSGSGVTGLDVHPHDEITAYFDQYSGQLISKIDFHDYGILAKWYSYGIPLHEGHLFGWPNLVLCLLTVLSLLLLIYWGVRMWWVRRPKGKVGAPPAPKPNRDILSFVVLMIVLGILMPLFGLSLIVIGLLEWAAYLIRGNRKTEMKNEAQV